MPESNILDLKKSFWHEFKKKNYLHKIENVYNIKNTYLSQNDPAFEVSLVVQQEVEAVIALAQSYFNQTRASKKTLNIC